MTENDDIENDRSEATDQTEATNQAEVIDRPRRLTRSREDRILAGVAGGLGRYFDVDPVIFRIAFAVSIFFGGFGGLVYIGMLLFVPVDDGTEAVVKFRGERGRNIARVVGVILLAFAAVFGFGALVAGAAFAAGLGYGVAVAGLIILIGFALVVLSFRGGAKWWLLLPVLALSIGVVAAAASDLDLEGGIGKRDYRPLAASAIPAGGYDLGVGRLAVDLRRIDWNAKRSLDLDVRVGAGQIVVAVPSEVCVVADAHAGAGEIRIAGQQADGTDVNLATGAGSRATPQLRLNAEVDLGQISVVNDDDVVITGRYGDQFDR